MAGQSANKIGRLVIICGLPGSGKTTLAKQIESNTHSIRMCPDDWLDALGINQWEEDVRDRIEKFQWELSKKLLQLGIIVIIEWGTWGRSERDWLRTQARDIGATVELHYLSASVDMLFERIQKRNQEDPPITREQVESWVKHIQVPNDAEFALFDTPIFTNDI